MSNPQMSWAGLSRLCRQVHKLLYESKDFERARKCTDLLEEILDGLPNEDLVIIRSEALALLHELRGEFDVALKHRLREVELMDKLYEDIRVHHYERSVISFMLTSRGKDDYRRRLQIISDLRRRY